MRRSLDLKVIVLLACFWLQAWIESKRISLTVGMSSYPEIAKFCNFVLTWDLDMSPSKGDTRRI